MLICILQGILNGPHDACMTYVTALSYNCTRDGDACTVINQKKSKEIAPVRGNMLYNIYAIHIIHCGSMDCRFFDEFVVHVTTICQCVLLKNCIANIARYSLYYEDI